MQFFIKIYFILSSILDGKRLLSLINRPWGMCISSAVLGAIMSLSIAPVEKWPFAVIALVFFMMQLFTCKYSSQVFILTILFFGTYSTLSLTWLNFVMEGFGEVPAVLSYVVIIGFSFGYVAAPYALSNMLIFRLAKKKKSVYLCCFVPIAFVIADYIVYFFLTGFPWLYAGYSCIEGPLKNYAPFIGVRGINIALYILSTTASVSFPFTFVPMFGLYCNYLRRTNNVVDGITRRDFDIFSLRAPMYSLAFVGFGLLPILILGVVIVPIMLFTEIKLIKGDKYEC